MAAATQCAIFSQEALAKLGERGGIKDARAQVQKVADAGFNVTSNELASALKQDTLTEAGISRRKAVQGMSDAGMAIELRAPVLKETGRVANERDLAGMLAEQEADAIQSLERPADKGKGRASLSEDSI